MNDDYLKTEKARRNLNGIENRVPQPELHNVQGSLSRLYLYL